MKTLCQLLSTKQSNGKDSEGYEYKSAFTMRQGQFEYQVTPLGPTNALATFHSDFNDCLWTCMDDSVAYYLDDILIYSAKGKEHEEHVRHMLCRLKKFVVYCIVKMCQV